MYDWYTRTKKLHISSQHSTEHSKPQRELHKIIFNYYFQPSMNRHYDDY